MATLHNYFFAVQPPPEVHPRIDSLTEELFRSRRGLGRPMERLRRHVSLASLGTDEEPMDDLAARAVAAMMAVRHPTFAAAFNRIALFNGGGGAKALVLRGDEGAIGFDLLRSAIWSALAAARLAPSRERPFEAHLTLVRGHDDTPEKVIDPVSWTVREFVLIHSYVGETRYEIVDRFPLAA